MYPVVHFEIPVDDIDRARGFYTEVFEWDVEEMPMGDGIYTSVITAQGDGGSGGINGAIIDRDEILVDPIITIEVPLIEAHLERVEAAGGSTAVPIGEIPHTGRYAYFTDTEGNVLGLWESIEPAPSH